MQGSRLDFGRFKRERLDGHSFRRSRERGGGDDLLIRANPLPVILRRPEHFARSLRLPSIKTLRATCTNGPGFAVLDRLPIDAFDIDDIVTVY